MTAVAQVAYRGSRGGGALFFVRGKLGLVLPYLGVARGWLSRPEERVTTVAEQRPGATRHVHDTVFDAAIRRARARRVGLE
ncbi:hypothetical protein E2562_011899 [Oryza meyeriana var. granulata]|uniref:Uncharacterized protein n=1 Tax=Oryza meyeriana var. granulata TaxID=110450 RepID=A0A6G1CGE2_9ORYZ|nr:hypothetical protein E2562_011899 [Oryza meyeriana var. granulata]